MSQVLFWIPIKTQLTPNGIPIFGFGAMLCLALFAAMYLAVRLAERRGISRDRLFDLAFWVFIGGIVGARIMFIEHAERPWSEFFRFWEGGIDFLGGAVGGWVGYGLAWLFSFRKYGISTMKLADVIAPAVCLGLLIGRLGCLLNGCCYGKVCSADESAYCLQFPLLTAPSKELVVNRGYQTSAGFALEEEAKRPDWGKGLPVVGYIEPGSPAAAAGLQRGDVIVHIRSAPEGMIDKDIATDVQLQYLLGTDWPRGESGIVLTVDRRGGRVELPRFTPRTLGLYPTQLYESISMALLLFLLLAYFPYRRHDGQVFVLLMLGYALHRFINESLRDDTVTLTDWNLTWSQIGSLGVFAAGLALEVYLRFTSPRLEAVPPPAQGDQPDAKQHAGSV